jgi:hypothetical protein
LRLACISYGSADLNNREGWLLASPLTHRELSLSFVWGGGLNNKGRNLRSYV